ncbi:MAG: hypothetical protein IPL53_16320 [Ignavibacteria bacterium]|nr:hypothetical protein [Ignavibacteria bacterium]
MKVNKVSKIKTPLTLIMLLVVLTMAFNNISLAAEKNSSQVNSPGSFQRSRPKFSEVRIYAVNQNDFKRMSDAGLIIDHSIRKPGIYLDAWLSEYEIDLLKNPASCMKSLLMTGMNFITISQR